MTKIKRRVNKTNRSIIRKGDLIFYCVLLAIPLIQICVFYFGVNFQSFFMAFQKRSGGQFVFDISSNIERFKIDISHSSFWTKIGNSFIVYLCTSLSGTVLAVIFSYYIYKKRTFCNFFKYVLFLPSILPVILLVVMFQKFVGEGIPAYLEQWFGAQTKSVLDISYSATSVRFTVITIYSIWISFGSQVLVYTGAMDRIPVEIVEAGRIDGTTSFTEFIHIIVPSIIGTIGTFLIAGIASIFTNQNNLFSFFNWNEIQDTEQTIGYYLFFLVYSDTSNMSGYTYASFLGVLCTIIVVPLSLGVRKLVERFTN